MKRNLHIWYWLIFLHDAPFLFDFKEVQEALEEVETWSVQSSGLTG